MEKPLPTRHESLALLRRIFAYFIPYKGAIAISVLSMLVVSAATAGSAYLVKPALDDIFINKDADSLVYIPLLFLLITLLKGAGRYCQNYFMNLSGLRVLETLRQQLFAKMIHLPLGYYENSQVGLLMARITNDVGMIRTSLPALVMLVRQVLTLLGLIGVVFYQNSWLAFWSILVLPLAVFPIIYFGRKLRKLGRKSQENAATISVVLQEVLSGIRVVKAFATEKRETDRFDKENERLVHLSMKQVSVSELSSPVMELVGALGIGLVIILGGHEVISGQSTPGTFFSFLAALVMLYEPIKSFNTANRTIQSALVGAERVFEILDAPDLKIESSGTEPLKGNFKELRFNNVCFEYNNGFEALSNITITIKAGERVAIVGPSGAGKTSLINLIPRFYEPTKGTIELNGKRLAEYNLPELRRFISIVSQDNFLFNLSVSDNISYGTAHADDRHAVTEAAKAAYADEFISQLSEGYDTIIGERGVKLSGGQKQRLTIARAIMKNAPLLILDEATSALDSQAEKIVQKALDNLMQDRTSIVIAHRLSTILNADRILVMENGRILAHGSHLELLGKNDLYTKLYTMQFEHEQKQSGE